MAKIIIKNALIGDKDITLSPISLGKRKDLANLKRNYIKNRVRKILKKIVNPGNVATVTTHIQKSFFCWWGFCIIGSNYYKYQVWL